MACVFKFCVPALFLAMAAAAEAEDKEINLYSCTTFRSRQ
ncbi:exported hypothetical protein [Pseudomonas sp. IT-P218]